MKTKMKTPSSRRRVICNIGFSREQAEYIAIAISYTRKYVRVQEATLATIGKGKISLKVFAVTAGERKGVITKWSE